MLEIYPKVGEGKGYICPVCKCQLSQPSRVAFKLSAVIADIECTCCEEEYYQTLPPEYSQQPRLSFLKKYGKIRYEPADESKALSLLDGFQRETLVSLEVRKRKATSHILWLNCFFKDEHQIIEKLVVAQRDLFGQQSVGLVVVIREELAYLVPEDVSELWVVKTEKDKGLFFNDLVNSELNRFEKVFVPLLSNTSLGGSISWESIFKVRPFSYGSKYDQEPTIVTFFCHPERFWMSSKWEDWLFQKAINWGLRDLLKPYFERRQLRKFKVVTEKLANVQRMEFHLIGFGKAKASVLFKDERLEKESLGVYQRWIPLLAKSDVVVGVFEGKLPARGLSGNSLPLGLEERQGFLSFSNEVSLKGFSKMSEVSDCLVGILTNKSFDTTR